MAEVLIHDFLLGFIKIYVLHYASIEPIYGKELHDLLLKQGYDISYGTLYPIFHKFEQKGYLKHEERNVNGKIRKYYSITKKGKSALDISKSKSKELFEALYSSKK